MKEVLQNLVKSSPGQMTTETPEMAQGTSYLLRNREVTNEDNFKMEVEGDKCFKNTGEIHRLHNWSRGIFQVVGAGGFIEYWSPLYNSENPHQVALLMIKYLGLKMEGKSQSEMENFWLSYDNVCHIDNLRLMKKPLPFPSPHDRLWLDVNKLIDELHLKGSSHKKCDII